MTTISIQRSESVHVLTHALKKSKDAEQKTRIRALIHLKEGATKTAVAKRFAISRTSLISWVVAYNEGGTSALLMSKGGRHEGNPKWDTAIFDALAREIDRGGYWSLPRMQEWIHTHHHQDIPEQTVWYRMDRLNYSYKSARPHPVQGNRERQETFKKGVSFHSWSR